MTRPITPHKGGRTARAPEARMTPRERFKLDVVLQRRCVKHTDWYIGHVNADYSEITGGNEMSTLDDFFGDSRTAKKECLHCGNTDGELLVAVNDAGGPTLWEHKECRDAARARRDAQGASARASADKQAAMDEWEEPKRRK